MKIFRTLCVFVILFFQLSASSQVPAYSSYPSASAVIFLDFDGHNVVGTSWTPFGMPLACSPSGLNDAQITEIFNRVAEDFRPFNINITTDSTKFLAAPFNRRTRVILTVTSSWYGSAGGVAFNYSFTQGDDTPCFVFSALLGNNSKKIAEAASHEAGHTLGLYHQAKYDGSCNKLSEYDTGQGSGEIGWAPIMGQGYYQNFTLWHNGPNNFGCNTQQNDLEIITSTDNGFGYRADDNGNDFSTATHPVFSNSQFNAIGVIEKNTDLDFFKFIMPGKGRFQLDAIPYNVGTGNSGSDLDMQVTLFDENHNTLSVYNPGALLNSVTDTLLNAGTYYLKVEGKGNLYAPSYASLGSYSLQGVINITETVLPLNRLELKGFQNGDLHQLNWSILSDKKIIQQVIEISTDGRNFSELKSSGAEARDYSYRPPPDQSIQYRLLGVFDDGHRYYSNIITIRPGSAGPKPRLIGNLIKSNNIFISSPGIKYLFSIVDLNGKTLVNGELTTGINSILIPNMSSGIYIIRITGNNQQWTEKLVRE